MSDQYTLTVTNDSKFPGSACVYQSDPGRNDPEVMTLAWFCKYLYPTTTVTFTWSLDYSFIWSRQGNLLPGVVFEASQVWDADLHKDNQVSLDYQSKFDAFRFMDLRQNPQKGSLYINQDGSIPIDEAAVGIAMSGSGIFAKESRSNWQFVFTPTPSYWITFGTFQTGEVIDVTSLSDSVEVEYPQNVFSMCATLNTDNRWEVGRCRSQN